MACALKEGFSVCSVSSSRQNALAFHGQNQALFSALLLLLTLLDDLLRPLRTVLPFDVLQ